MKTHIHVAAVFEPSCKEVTHLRFHSLFRKGDIAHFSPVDLQEFSRHAFKAQGQVVWRLLADTTHLADIVVESCLPALIGMLAIGSCQFQHSPYRQTLVHPIFYLCLQASHPPAALSPL